MRNLLIGVVTTTVGLFAAVALAGSGSVVCMEKSPGSCSGKGSTKFHSGSTNSCYSLKASCKGDFVGATWQATLSDVGKTIVIETFGVSPECEASAKDPTDPITGVKASCKTAYVDTSCGDLSGSTTSTKASLKMRPELCTPCCAKPDKITGCTNACL